MVDELRHPLGYADYRRLWVARLASTIAQSVMVIVIGWQVYDLARRTMPTREAALQLGLIGLAQFLPVFALTLVAGWTVDSVDRRRVAATCLALQLACALALAAITATGRVTLPSLYAVAMMLGVARAFSPPATNALAPSLVPRVVLPRAVAIGSIAGRVGAIVGPAFGGYLYAWVPAAPYAAAAGCLTISVVSMLRIRTVTRIERGARRHPWQEMTEGLRYVLANRLVLGAISLDLFAVLLGGATAMLPIFARDILHTGPEGLGHLRAAPAVGAIATALWFSGRPLRRQIGIKMLASVAIFGAATTVFGLSRWLPLSLAMLAVLGAADMLSVYVRQSLIQLSTPDAMRGRVGAVSALFISASNELGEAESGFLAAAIGPVAAVVAGGLGAILVAGLWARWFPSLRSAGSFEQHVA